MEQGVAVFLMLVGIGLIGALTATIASYFVQERTNATKERLERIEALLTQLERRNSDHRPQADHKRKSDTVRVGHARSKWKSRLEADFGRSRR